MLLGEGVRLAFACWSKRGRLSPLQWHLRDRGAAVGTAEDRSGASQLSHRMPAASAGEVQDRLRCVRSVGKILHCCPTVRTRRERAACADPRARSIAAPRTSLPESNVDPHDFSTRRPVTCWAFSASTVIRVPGFTRMGVLRTTTPSTMSDDRATTSILPSSSEITGYARTRAS